MALSIIVPTRDRAGLLDGCLRSIRAAMGDDDELIVVDSGSRDGLNVALVVKEHGADLVRMERPGTSRARNAGADRARHGLLAFVDDDVRVAPGWARAIEDAAADGVAFVTGRLAVPKDHLPVERPVGVTDDSDPAALVATTIGTIGHGGNLLLRRDVWDDIGGFDEGLGPGTRFGAAEDLDLFDRLFAAGFEGRYAPAALGWHEQWRSRRSLLALDWRYGVGLGARLVKLVRTDRRRARSAFVEHLWRSGLRNVVQAVAQRHEFAVVLHLTRLAGTLAGAAAGALVPLRDGRYG